ncbi:hypothetical protein FSP39_001871 [Pinctada imbricata]|uniref:LRAT domain-containing protein n=1 Tax=Pinctada imbricata TaxID=66713 RepID=A0AA88Y2X7_PINIB|nr:hypothetical protein FSP39_001871 [Pinctada imbricata]
MYNDFRMMNQLLPTCIECVETIHVKRRGMLLVGDHIINGGVLYDHHAIVKNIEPDERDENNVAKAKVTLIHFSNNFGVSSWWTKAIRGKANIKQTVEHFDFEIDNIMVVLYRHMPFPPAEIVRRAEQELQTQKFQYDLFGNNCEHFATFCVTGRKLSMQVLKINMTAWMYYYMGFRGLGDERERNRYLHEYELICNPCFQRNVLLLSAEKRPLRERHEVERGDVISFLYHGLDHDAIVLQVHEEEVGNGSTVTLTFVHYAFCGYFRYRTIQEERKTFSLDGSVSVIMYNGPQFDVYSPAETVERAGMRIGEQQFFFFSNDSSHFARWCKLRMNRPG